MGVVHKLQYRIHVWRSSPVQRAPRHRGHALARTVRHGTAISRPNSGGLGNLMSGQRMKLMAEAADDYDRSLDDSNG